MKSAQLIEELESITKASIELIETRFLSLSKDQLSWRPSKENWSIIEIAAHLNQYAEYYHAAFKRKISKTSYKKPAEIFVSSPLGRAAWKSMKLGNLKNVKRKMKSPKSYNPTITKELITGQDLERFLQFQQELLIILSQAAHVNLRRIKIPISVSKIIRLKLGDALMFVIYHNERHIQQALNLLSNKDFPRS